MNGSVGKREADNLVYKEKKVRQMTNFSVMGYYFHIVKEKKISWIFFIGKAEEKKSPRGGREKRRRERHEYYISNGKLR